MSDNTASLLQAEEEMAKVVERINSSLENLKKFESASNTLDKASAKSTEVLTALTDAARCLETGAKVLNQEGITSFRKVLAQKLTEASDVNRKKLEKMQKQMSTTMLLVISIGTLNLAVLGFLVFKLIGG